MKFARKSLYLACIAIFLACIPACKVSDDATAAAQQMTKTAADLSAYYGALADSVKDTIALNELDASFSKIPFNDASRQPIQDTLTEISKRQEAAQSLARLAESMSKLSGSSASSDVSSSATALGNELVHVKALPGGSPVPDALGKAGAMLMQYIQQRKEKEAARAMDETLTAFVALFEKEQPVYDSIFRTHVFLASQVANDLIRRQAVDPTPMLAPALAPFHLLPLPPDPQMRSTLTALAVSRLKTSADEASRNEKDVSSAMLSALREMSSRVHLLATEKPMQLRGNPLSLKIVESWVASAI